MEMVDVIYCVQINRTGENVMAAERLEGNAQVLAWLKECVRGSGLDASHIDFPGQIMFSCHGNDICMTLCGKAIWLVANAETPFNMQDNDAAFEAWALILHIHCGASIQLALDSNVNLPQSNDILLSEKGQYTYGHYNRFLYRVMKFRKQFCSWFEVSDDRLATAVDQFEQALQKYVFCNNSPLVEATEYPNKQEPAVEAAFSRADQTILAKLADAQGVGVSKLYRQLPVGLFLNQPKAVPSTTTAIFTGKASAIDLWGLDDHDLAIYELKTDNKMVGIITELMFYANYVYDMFVDRENTWKPREARKDYRGRLILWNKYKEKSLTGVRAFMLADALHPLITPKVIEAMGSDGIRYGALSYEWNLAEKSEDVRILNVRKYF